MQRIIRVGDGCVVGLAEAREPGAMPASPAERRECAELAPAARADYLAARLAARRALRHAGHEHGPAVTLRRRAGWPPLAFVSRPPRHPRPLPVALSLAHRDGRGAAALAPPGARVGVDLERSGALHREQLRYFAGEGERESGPSDGAALWALKEAAWKALGLAQDLPFHALALEFDGARKLRAVRVADARFAAHAVVVRPWPCHLVAVVRVDG